MRAIVAVLLLVAAIASAADDATPEPSPWTFEAMPYAWIPGNFGSATVKGRTADIDVTVKDALDLATGGNAFTAGGWFALTYDRWTLFVDAYGGYAEERIAETVPTQLCTVSVDGRGKLKFDFVDVGLGYRLGQWTLPQRRRPMTLGVYAGTRYSHFGIRLNAKGGVAGAVARSAAVSRAYDWADPLIGVRWNVPIFDALSLDFRGDIGGFDASSKLIWGLVGGVRYWLPWTPWSLQPWLSAGYRVLAFDREDGADNELDLQFRGPMGGLGLQF